MDMDALKINKIVQGIMNSRLHEIGCDECFAYLDIYADLLLEGKDVGTLYPDVHDHLQRCRNCHEEFDVLMELLRGVEKT